MYENSVSSGCGDKNPLTMMSRRPHLQQGSLDHGLTFPLSCDMENPFYSRVPLGSGKICVAHPAATVFSYVLIEGLENLCLDMVLCMHLNNLKEGREQIR